VTQIRANDSDSVANGNGLVLFHLGNNQKQFYIDSKNGSIMTTSDLSYDTQKEYNVTVIASDLGQPSLSSTAWLFIRVQKSNNSLTHISTKDRVFQEQVYTYFIPSDSRTPYFLTKMNVTSKYKELPMEFQLYGGERIISSFRIGPKSGEIYIVKKLASGIAHDMLVKAYNAKEPRGFDTRQGNPVSDRYLGKKKFFFSHT